MESFVDKGVLQKRGLPPGSLVFVGDPSDAKVRITLFDYDSESLEEREIGAEELKGLSPYTESSTVTWINIDGLHETKILDEICEVFSLHPLVVEDILNTNQRPEIEMWEDYIFLVMKMIRYNPEDEEIDIEQFSIVFGENFVLSFQEKPGDVFPLLRKRMRKKASKVRKSGPDYLAYALADTVIDHYFFVLERMEEKMEEIELEVIEDPSTKVLAEINRLKRELLLFRKSVVPLREALNILKKEDSSLVTKELFMYLSDAQGHVLQVADVIENFRDLLAGMHDIYLSSMSQKLNEIMKFLTMFSTIFIPLTFIAGIYGMNFNTEKSPYNMPELAWKYGYPATILVMLLIAAGMLFYFKKKKWI